MKQNRDQLLKAAAVVFGKKGYTATKLEEIAQEADLTRGAISWHFKNKQNIFRALVEEGSIEFFSSMEQYLNRNSNPVERIKGFIQYLLNDAEHRRYQVAILSKVRGEAPLELEDMLKQLTELEQTIIRGLETTIEDGVTEGVFEIDDPILAARSIYAFFWGVFTNPQFFEFEEDRLKAFLEQFVRNLLGARMVFTD